MHMSWTVKMWHFDQDALTSYPGGKFEITWGDSLNLFRYYSKENGSSSKNARRVRKEVQEYPNKSLENAFVDKLEDDENTRLLNLT